MRPGYQQLYERQPERFRGRRRVFFDTIDAAYNYAEETLKRRDVIAPIILIHSGVYRNEFLVIDSNVAMIGAGQCDVCFD